MDIDKELLIEKILYLSDRLRGVQFYNILEPWKFKSVDYIELQQAAKKIAEFLGLSDLTFVIAISKQEKETAGHIELDNSNEVFIEIDSNSNYDDRTLLAILSHEICHKYLQLQNIKRTGRENEILTDIATIYLGLGKLILNGCNSSNNNVGYLQRRQYAYIYKLICKSRRVPEEIMVSNIDPQIANEIRSIVFDSTFNYYSNEDAIQLLNEVVNQSFLTNQKTYAELKKHVLIINNLMESLNSQYQNYHKRNFKNKKEWAEKINNAYVNESANYFKNLAIVNEINLTWKKGKDDNPTILNELLNDFINYLNKMILSKSSDLKVEPKVIIDCPNCNHRMSFNKDIIAKISCKKCTYIFIVDNTPFSKLEYAPLTSDSSKLRKGKKLKRLLNIFKRNKV